jgi:hypothetical protein
VFGLLVIATCLILNRTLKHKRNFILTFGVPILVHLGIIGVYAYIVLPLYRSISPHGAGPFLRFVFRLVIHPLINFVNALVTQTFVPDFENTTSFLATGISPLLSGITQYISVTLSELKYCT